MKEHQKMKVLAPDHLKSTFGRRQFFAMSAGVGAAVALAGCGSNSGSGSGSEPGDSTGDGAAPATGAAGATGSVSVYDYAQYTAPENVTGISDDVGIDVVFDYFSSPDETIAKLQLADGTAGYDVVIVTDVWVPQMIEMGLLAPIDRSILANFDNVDPFYLDRPWDPDNKHTIPKAIGTTGIIYDTSVIESPIASWEDFFDAAASEPVSGQVSLLDISATLLGIGFAMAGKSAQEVEVDDVAASEQLLSERLIPHVKAFDTYPSAGLLTGDFVLAQVFSGDARTVVVEDPERFKWVLPEGRPVLWMDSYAVSASAPNPTAAHAYIDYMLRPDVSVGDVSYHGYNTGVRGIQEDLGDVPAPEIIFLPVEDLERTVPSFLARPQQQIVDAYNRLKAGAGS